MGNIPKCRRLAFLWLVGWFCPPAFSFFLLERVYCYYYDLTFLGGESLDITSWYWDINRPWGKKGTYESRTMLLRHWRNEHSFYHNMRCKKIKKRRPLDIYCLNRLCFISLTGGRALTSCVGSETRRKSAGRCRRHTKRKAEPIKSGMSFSSVVGRIESYLYGKRLVLVCLLLLLLYECMYYTYSCAHLYVMRAVSFFLSLCIQTPYKKKQRSKKVGNADWWRSGYESLVSTLG